MLIIFNYLVSKLSKFVGRTNKTPITPQTSTGSDHNANPTTKVTFSETAEGEMKEVVIFIDPANRHRFGRRSTPSEAILGLSVSPFPDGQRMMIANFMPNFIMARDKTPIKIGDWLKSIDGMEINATNLDEVLLSYRTPVEIIVCVQRTSEEESIVVAGLTKILNFAMMIETFEKMLVANGREPPPGVDGEQIFSLMYLTMEGLDEQGPEGQDVLYCYPPKHDNLLYGCRGSFLTLNSILKVAPLSSTPEITTVTHGSRTYNISYTIFNEDVLLVAVRDDHLTLEELRLKTREIVRFFEFINRNLSENFYPQNIFDMNILCRLLEMEFASVDRHRPSFEASLLEPHYVPLPKEAQLRIDDALSEMEAMDYREWNSEPLKSQREFFIIGSVLYYKRYMLASHLPPSDLLDIEAFLRVNGIFALIEHESVKDLIVWREIFPKKCEIHGTKMVPLQGRWFLAVVGINHMCMAVVLEHRDDQLLNNFDKVGPSAFYVEEIQDTLEHLQTGGIEVLASTWIRHHRRPQINRDESVAPTEIQPVAAVASSSTNRKTEIISILKRRKDSMENVGSASVHSQTTTVSEDSETNRNKYENDNDDESDSDWDGFPDSQRSSSGFDMSEMTETLLREVSDIIPTKITAGKDNVLFHYVQIEVGEGYILSPTNVLDNHIVQTFRRTCQLIHAVLQNTIKFRQILSEDAVNKPNSGHRSLVAIKEHGVLVNLRNEKGELVEFWVIGRLFNSPTRELYVCHRADVPQNLVEIAFRLSLHCAG